MQQIDRRGQFVVRETASPAAAGSDRHYRLDKLSIDTYGDIRVHIVTDAEGTQIGALVGTPVDEKDQRLVSGTFETREAFGTGSIDAFIEENLLVLLGSYVLVFDNRGHKRLYLDSGSSKSLVYEPIERRAGSTAAAILDDTQYSSRLRQDLITALDVAGDGWIAADLTAHSGVKRLICNHYLDLDDWTARRHWPNGDFPGVLSVDDAAAVITGTIKQTIESAASGDSAVCVGLTAGFDSRVLLACCRDIIDKVEFVTVRAPEENIDVVSATRLARLFGLRHRVLPYVKATHEQAQAWLYRAGHVVTGANMLMHPSVEPLQAALFVGGAGGEVGRGFLWLGAHEDTSLTATGLISRLKLPAEKSLVASVDHWLANCPNCGVLNILDLAYLELRMSSWAFGQCYATPGSQISPFLSRRIITAVLSVPPEQRRGERLFIECLRQTWPELLVVPINRYGDLRDPTRKLLQAARHPQRIYRKFRQVADAWFA